MNKKITIKCIVILLAFFTGCSKPGEKVSVDSLKIRWQIGENNYQGKSAFISAFTILNSGENDMPSAGWNIYFNFPRRIKPETVTGNMNIRHINGDFYELSPKEIFSLAAGDSLIVEFVSSEWALNKSDAPAGLYLVTKDKDGKEEKPQVISQYTIGEFTGTKQTQSSPNDHIEVVSASSLREKYLSAAQVLSHETTTIIPTPVHFASASGKFVVDQNVKVVAGSNLKKEKQFLEDRMKELLQNALVSNTDRKINLLIGSVNHQGKALPEGSEGYKLEILKDAVNITGTDAAGVFYGIQSFFALFPVEVFKAKNSFIEVTQGTIVDYPRFGYRGIHLDVARNFHTKATVKKMIDLMSFYKLNKLHFHVSDDEGWRVEMESLPELTEIGSQRGHDASGKGMVPSFGSGPYPDDAKSGGSGYYSEEDFIEILRYADDRHIEVIPKVDMPGHARAAIKAMDVRYERLKGKESSIDAAQYLLRDLNDSSEYSSVQMWNDNVICVCQESTYNFVATVVNDFVKLYEKAGVPIRTFHIGADEVPHGVWEKSPVCKEFFKSQELKMEGVSDYFFKRVSRILKERNLNMGGWEEIALRKTKTDKGTSLEANPDFVNENFRPYVWNNVWGWEQEDVGYKLANAGYKTVLGNVTNLYFDLAYEKHPDEIGYYWGAFIDTRKVYEFNPFDIYLGAKDDKFGNPLDQTKIKSKVRLTEAGKKNILGIQGQIWGENIKGEQVLEYMAFPKLLALTERAWARNPDWSTIADDSQRQVQFDKSWSVFATALGQRELPRLDYIFGEVNYRISPPGAEIKDGKLVALAEFPGLIIRYTTDGSEPTATSPVYSEPVDVGDNTVKLKAFNTTNRSSRTVVVKAG